MNHAILKVVTVLAILGGVVFSAQAQPPAIHCGTERISVPGDHWYFESELTVKESEDLAMLTPGTIVKECREFGSNRFVLVTITPHWGAWAAVY